MNIIVVSIDEPIYLFHFWKNIFEKINKQILKVYIYKTKRENWGKWLYQSLYNLLLILILYNSKDIFKIFKNYLVALIKRKRFSLSLNCLCKQYNINFSYINSVNSIRFREELKQLSPDLVLAQVPVIVKRECLNIPKIGWVNKHFGLLPDYKGAFPVLWAYWNRENKMGVTIHLMNEKFDEGEILRQEAIYLQSKDTVPCILKKLNTIASKLMLDYIHDTTPKKPLKIKKERYFNKPSLMKLLKYFILHRRSKKSKI